MKKLFLMLLSVGILVGCSSHKVNMSDEMKIDNPIDLSKKDGADSVDKEIMKTLCIMHILIFIIWNLRIH